MQQIISIIILLILTGCTSAPQYREVMVNKAVKVFSEDYHEQAENYTFKWKSTIGPNNKKILFDLKNDMLIFTPKTVGEYKVTLSIEDISEEVVAEEIFYFKAIPETTKVAIVESEQEMHPYSISVTDNKPNKQATKKILSKPIKNQKTHKSSKLQKQPPNLQIPHGHEYAIQISSWPSLEEARKHQLELLNEGFDAYTQRYYWKKKDKVWYRVRIGNFLNKDKALEVKKQIDLFTGISTWLDIITTK